VRVTTDPSVNAATITFDESARGRDLRDFPIEMNGTIIAMVTFTASGRLAQLELLDAANQLPPGLSET
jgi:hypothetical protein